MYVVDSSVWVWLFLDFDVHHDTARNIFQEISTSKIILPYCVINEVSSVLTYKWGKNIADSFLKFVTQNEDIFIEQDTITEEVQFFLSLDKKMSFTDIAVIKIAWDYNLELITFDEQMIQVFKTLK